jgi:hypothetical protein
VVVLQAKSQYPVFLLWGSANEAIQAVLKKGKTMARSAPPLKESGLLTTIGFAF